MPSSYSALQMTHKNMCRTTDMQHFHLVTLLDMTLTLTFTYYKAHTYTQPSSTPEKPLEKFGLAAFISHISAADKAKSDRF